jgi:serine/threonine protein kinase
MNDASPEMLSIFSGALERSSAAERAAYLDAACGHDAALRARVEELLRAHAEAGGFFRERSGACYLGATIDQSAVAGPGTRVGPYQLLEPLGEGGMGAVWLAQQHEPVRRFVAVKLIKAGMDSRQVLARFEAERQALALMDHSNIARVFDAGTTADGRPYFVMELVRGVPLTRYCNERRLTVRQRLELFVPVCQAIQHAHQKGIIHRDIKPSNVLVAHCDDRPVPKVIDFGVAKATGQPLTEQTLHTGLGAVVGTPEYMSPEQAGLNQLDVDTRSDVYALGVLLYELLTGSPPFSRKQLEKAGVLEMLRVIREQEPPQPSARLSTAEGLPALAADRGTEPAKLTRLVRGELDWIVLKALEKNRSRRYETASALAADVQRHLADEPVQAGPPSRWYRLQKFVRRNKVALATAGAVTLAVLLAVSISTWRIWLAKEEASAARDAEEAQKRLAVGERDLSNANLGLAEEVLERLYFQWVEKGLPRDPQREEENLTLLREALRFYSRFAETNAANPRARVRAGRAYIRAGVLLKLLRRDEEAEPALGRGIGLLEQEPEDSPEWLDARQQLGHAHNERGLLFLADFRFPEAEKAFRQARAIHEALVARVPRSAPYRQNLSASCGNLARVLRELGRLTEAERVLGKGQALAGQLVWKDPRSAHDQNSLAGCLDQRAVSRRQRGDLEGALEFHRRAIHHQEQAVLWARGDPQFRVRLSTFLGSLTETLRAMRNHEAVLQASERRRTLAVQLVKDYPRVPDYLNELIASRVSQAEALKALGRILEARKVYEEVLPLMGKLVKEYAARPLYQRNLAVLQRNHAKILDRTGLAREAEVAFRQALDHWKKLPQARRNTADYRRVRANIHLELGTLLTRREKFPEAEEVLRESVRTFRELAREFPEMTGYRWGLASSQGQLGMALQASRQPEKAEKALREALALHRKLVSDHPKASEYRHGLASTLNGLGYHLWKRGRSREAEQAYGEALDRFTWLAEQSPGDLLAGDNLATVQYNLALLYGTTSRAAQAEEAFRKVRGLQEKLVAQAPDMLELHANLAGTVNNQGMLQLERGNLAGARALFEQAVRHQRNALKPDPELPRYQRGMGTSCLNLGVVLVKLRDRAALSRVAEELAGVDWMGSAQSADYYITCAALARADAALPAAERAARARAHADQAVAVLRKAAGGCPDTPGDRYFLMEQIDAAALRLDRNGWHPQAIEVFRQCLALAKKSPGALKYTKGLPEWLSVRHRRLCLLLRQAGRIREAKEAYREVVAVLEKLVQGFPEKHGLKHDLALMLNNLSVTLRVLGEPARDRRDLLERGLKYQQEAVAADQKNPAYCRQLGLLFGNLAETLIALGDHAGAAGAAREQPRAKPDWRSYRSAAYFLGLCLPLAERDARLSAEERHALTGAYAREAQTLLREAARRIPDDPAAQDDLARFLATWEEPRLRNPTLAVELAGKATRRAPKVGRFWNTLGVAQYRARNWDAAVTALARSVSLTAGGDGSDHFVLAVAHWQLAAAEPGHRKASREWFRRGVEWMAKQEPALKKNEPYAAQLHRLRAEAATLLGIQEKPPGNSQEDN